MYTVFIEYKITPDDLAAYKQDIKRIESSLPTSLISYEHLKATDQDNLFVERLVMDSLEDYHAWKEELQKEEPNLPWTPIFPYIQGGHVKFNIWAFQRNK